MKKDIAFITVVIITLVAIGAYYVYHFQKNDITTPTATSSLAMALVKESDSVSINITYPAIDERFSGAKEANASIKQELDIRIAAFEKEATESVSAPIDLPQNIKSTANGSPFVEDENDRYVSIFFAAEWYLRGSAHPYHTVHTYVFDKKERKLVTVQDFFKPYSAYFEFLSQYAYDDLIKQSQEGDVGFIYDKDMLKSGTEATLENFRHALPTKDGLVIYFDEYQVAPYAAGPQQVVVPYEKLGKYVNPDGILSMYIR